MERGGDKHGPRLDEELHAETEPLERGRPTDARAEAFRQPQAEQGGDVMSLLVRHVMTEAPQTAGVDLNAADAAGLMRQYDVGVIPVVDGEKLIGLVTDRDLVLRVLAERQDPSAVLLGDIVTKSPVTVTPDTKLADARDLMAEHKIRRLPVVKADQLVGIVSIGDIAVHDASKRAVGDALSEVSESPSTIDLTETPERGTPERVRQNRQT
jgi:CBS domain-containing protein